MDFSFDEDQIALRDSVSRFLMTEATPELLREFGEGGSEGWLQLRARLAAQGLCAISVPEAHGGLGLGDVDWALMTQELGYYAIPDAVADTAYLAASLLSKVGEAHPLCARWLPRIADGSASIALAHPLNPWVADVQSAELVLWAQPSQHGLELHALAAGTLSASALPSIDPSRRLAAVSATPNPATLVLAAGQAQPLWDETIDRAAVCVAGQLVGLAQRMLDLAVDYVAQRKQFGQPIGSFQAVKHQLADVATRIEFARPVLYRAALALDRGEPGRAALASHAKLACADAAWTAARKSIQVHGAMGYTWEVDLQLFMKRAWALDAAWGDRGFHKSRLGQALLRDDAPLGPSATLPN